MLFNVYSLYDVKSESYVLPFFSVSDSVAVRTVCDSYLAADSTMSRHPEDFTLYRIGLFDDCRGCISGSERVYVTDLISLYTRDKVVNDG